MKRSIYGVDQDAGVRIGIMPRPRGGEWLDDDIKSVREQNVDVLVSLLTEDEVSELDLLHEAAVCRSEGIRIPGVSHPGPWPSQRGRPDRKAELAF